MKHYGGLDLSLVGTGVMILDEAGKIIHQELITTTPKQEIEERILHIEESVIDFFSGDKLSITYVEGLAFGARGQAMLQLAGLHFHIRIALRLEGINFKVIAPPTVKKFVTGKGNAKKELMLLRVYKKWGESFNDNNLCDAYSLARLALEENVHADD
jgi:crossover junction endodeoxyribonuclease RuvC